MPQIFLSYSREDQPRARRFAEALQRERLDVWWDQTLQAGDAYDKVTLHGQVGKISPGKDDKSLQVSFTAEQTATIPQSRSIKLSFFKGDKSVDQMIEAIEAGGGK